MRFERLGLVTLATLATLLVGLTVAVVLGPGRRLAAADSATPQVTQSPAGAATPSPSVSGAKVGSTAPAGVAVAADASQRPPTTAAASTTAAAAFANPAACATNTHAQYVLVSISQQHAWMCAGHQQVYSTAVTTGATVDGDQTPTGSWEIQAKQTDRYLAGPGYDDYVKYWLPFWGDFGFHDASWQTFAFGGAQWQADGSHGCVHLPTPAMAWLYSWAQVGAAVTIRA